MKVQPAHGRQRQQRGRQPDLEPPARRSTRPLVGLGGGVGGLLGAGGLGGAGDLGGAEPLLHAAEIGRDPLGHGAGVPRPVLRLARQAVLASAISSASAPQASRRAVASARSPSAALRRISPRTGP